MAKAKFNEMTQEQLETYAQRLSREIETLNQVIEASNTTVFDLLINEVKEEMKSNIAEEEWKKMKENQKKIESYRSIEKTLQNQEDLLERKNEELEEVQNCLCNYQTHLFDSVSEEVVEEAIETGYEWNNLPLRTGDVFKQKDKNGEIKYFLIKASAEMEDSFAIVSNSLEGERCLQYPSNRKLLDEVSFVGNIYNNNDGVQQDALNALSIIFPDKNDKVSNDTTAQDG